MNISDLIMSLRRRVVLIALSFTVVLLLAISVAIALPPVFRSTGVILVESQQIPESLLPKTTTSTVDDRFQLILQRIMTRENQLSIIQKYGLFADDPSSRSTSDMLNAMEKRIDVNPIHSGRRGASAIAFEVSFEHRTPAVAQAVANELVTLFLNENARIRTKRASETNDFLTREAARLESELAHLEEKLANHKQQFGDALPEHLSMRMAMLQRTEEALRNTQRERKETLEEKRMLEVEFAAAQYGYAAETSVQRTDYPDTLDEMKQEYLRLSQMFTESHPDLKVLGRRIAAVEESQTGAGVPAVTPTLSGSDLRVLRVQTEINAASGRLASLQAQELSLKRKIEKIEGQILKTPQVQRSLTTLMRNYSNAQQKYEEIRAKQIDAQITESLEQQEKAERFVLVEPPVLPDSPVKPNRTKIMLLGVLLAAGSSGGLALMLETLNRRIRGSGPLTHLLGRPPLVVIPYIRTSSEIRRKRAQRWLALLVLVGVIAGAAVLVHMTYMPLDVLILKIAARVG